MISAVLNKHILVSSIMITVLIIFISSIFVITTVYGQDAAPTADAGPTQTQEIWLHLMQVIVMIQMETT